MERLQVYKSLTRKVSSQRSTGQVLCGAVLCATRTWFLLREPCHFASPLMSWNETCCTTRTYHYFSAPLIKHNYFNNIQLHVTHVLFPENRLAVNASCFVTRLKFPRTINNNIIIRQDKRNTPTGSPRMEPRAFETFY